MIKNVIFIETKIDSSIVFVSRIFLTSGYCVDRANVLLARARFQLRFLYSASVMISVGSDISGGGGGGGADDDVSGSRRGRIEEEL